MIIFPNAKINIGLNIIEKRNNGYHNLETIFYPINLQDALEVTILNNSEQPYQLTNSGTVIEGNPDNNLIVKAYNLIKENYSDVLPVKINIYKHIPMGAGLGGGSADAAFMIKLLNKKFKLNMSDEEMEKYASKLGADCAFFIKNKPVYATGIGDVFEDIDISLKGYNIVLVKPDISIPTKEAFQNINPHKRNISVKELVKKPIEEWKDSIENDFEENIFRLYPEIAAIKDELYDLGAIYSAMSGSGSTVYGIFKEPVEHVEEKFCNCFCRQRELE